MLGKLKINQISLGGLSLRNDDYMFSVDGLFDHDKTIYESELFSNGGYANGSKINNKKIALSGYIKTNDIGYHMALNKIFNDRNTQELLVDIEGFGVLSITVMVSNIASDFNNIKSCQLIAYDPYLYGATRKVLIKESRGTGIKFPLKFPIRFERENIDNALYNESPYMTYPVITITGPCKNMTIENVTTKEKLYFNFELYAGDTLVIDNRPRSRGIYLNDKNRIDLRNGDWITCVSGVNNFAFSRVSNSSESSCTVEIQSRWL